MSSPLLYSYIDWDARTGRNWLANVLLSSGPVTALNGNLWCEKLVSCCSSLGGADTGCCEGMERRYKVLVVYAG